MGLWRYSAPRGDLEEERIERFSEDELAAHLGSKFLSRFRRDYRAKTRKRGGPVFI
jgi:hypothetical protein